LNNAARTYGLSEILKFLLLEGCSRLLLVGPNKVDLNIANLFVIRWLRVHGEQCAQPST